MLNPPPSRPRSRIDVFIHYVWTTRRRDPWLKSHLETPIYRCVGQEVARFGCRTWAIGGIEDHVHLLVRFNATTTIAELIKAVKATSSTLSRELTNSESDGWQDNYAAFSVSRKDVTKVCAYIKNQKQHHESGQLWPSVEDLDFENLNSRFIYPDEPSTSPF